MGGDWRLPTREELSLMLSQTNASKTYMGGVYGVKVESKSDPEKVYLLACIWIDCRHWSQEPG